MVRRSTSSSRQSDEAPMRKSFRLSDNLSNEELLSILERRVRRTLEELPSEKTARRTRQSAAFLDKYKTQVDDSAAEMAFYDRCHTLLASGRAAAKSSRDAYARLARQAHNDLQPIAALPVETLRDIFDAVAADPAAAASPNLPEITAVFHRWRVASTSYGWLWRRIEVAKPNRYSKTHAFVQLHKLQTLLDRTSGVLIDVRIDTAALRPTPATPATRSVGTTSKLEPLTEDASINVVVAAEMLRPHIWRCRSLDLTLVWYECAQKFYPLPPGLANLQHLKVYIPTNVKRPKNLSTHKAGALQSLLPSPSLDGSFGPGRDINFAPVSLDMSTPVSPSFHLMDASRLQSVVLHGAVTARILTRLQNLLQRAPVIHNLELAATFVPSDRDFSPSPSRGSLPLTASNSNASATNVLVTNTAVSATMTPTTSTSSQQQFPLLDAPVPVPSLLSLSTNVHSLYMQRLVRAFGVEHLVVHTRGGGSGISPSEGAGAGQPHPPAGGAQAAASGKATDLQVEAYIRQFDRLRSLDAHACGDRSTAAMIVGAWLAGAGRVGRKGAVGRLNGGGAAVAGVVNSASIGAEEVDVENDDGCLTALAILPTTLIAPAPHNFFPSDALPILPPPPHPNHPHPHPLAHPLHPEHHGHEPLSNAQLGWLHTASHLRYLTLIDSRAMGLAPQDEEDRARITRVVLRILRASPRLVVRCQGFTLMKYVGENVKRELGAEREGVLRRLTTTVPKVKVPGRGAQVEGVEVSLREVVEAHDRGDVQWLRERHFLPATD